MESAGSPAEREVLYRIFEFAPDAILLVEEDGRVVRANEQVERMFGYPRHELIGQLVEVLIPRRYAERHIRFRSEYIASPRMRPMGAGLQLFGRRKDGTELPVEIMLSPIDSGGRVATIAVVRDATERRRVETEAQRALETSVKELHHRVKNNLQVISSLLHLQSTYTTDQHTHEILKESQTRVHSIALVHEKLYRSSGATAIDFAEYVRDLAHDVLQAYAVDGRQVRLQTSVADIRLGIDTAIPCGLIVNELVSNALKHAFPRGQAGEVVVDLRSEPVNAFTLTVRDNGVGLPPDFDWRTTRSLGLQLVTDLARQLEATLHVDGSAGTTVQLRFREVQYKDRN